MKQIDLSEKEKQQFWKQGYLGPYTALTPKEMVVVRNKINPAVLNTYGFGV